MDKPRARELEIPFEGRPGPLNAITDVPELSVGHVTLIDGDGSQDSGTGSVRTGVTAIWPRGGKFDPVFAAWFTLNGCGEMTGTTWIEESGLLYGPVLLTNTLSVRVVYEAVNTWVGKNTPLLFVLPVVAETFDGVLNDIQGRHVRQEDVFLALESAEGGRWRKETLGVGRE